MDLLRSSIFLLIVTSLSPSVTQSMRYELKSGQAKCIEEDIHNNTISVGKYFIVNPNEDHPLPDSHKFTIRVMPPKGNLVHEADNVDSGQFAFTAYETGNYIACFYVVPRKPEVTMTVDFDWRTGVHTKEWSNVAKKSQVETMENEVKKLFDTVESIHDEMYYLREREEEMQVLNRSTNSKMAWLSLVSLGVCLSVAGLQFWHLKTFFEKKKLI